LLRPDLRVGALGSRWDEDDPDSVMAEHYFAHDGKFAYDSLGCHALPYDTRPEYPDQALDVADHGIAEEEWDSAEELDRALYAAMRHIRQRNILQEVDMSQPTALGCP
jgi:hypothetical protein